MRTKTWLVVASALFAGGCRSGKISDAGFVDNLNAVDPMIGGVGLVLQPTRPTVHLPNSLIRVYPVKSDQLDDQIHYFPLTVTSHRVASVFAFMPVRGPVDAPVWDRRVGYERERATPYAYSARLEEPFDSIEFTPAARSGFFKMTFGGPQERYLRLKLIGQRGALSFDGRRTITGSEEFNGMRAFVYAETDTDVALAGSRDGKGVLLRLAPNADQARLRYGISYISVEQARRNLVREIPDWDFAKLRRTAEETWRTTLSQIRVKGGTPAQRRVFYTALYRCYGSSAPMSTCTNRAAGCPRSPLCSATGPR